MTQSDQQLIDAAGRGDAEAFEMLYRRYRDWAWRLAMRFCQDPDLAQDVVQEVFFYLLRKAPHLKLTARLTTFLYPAVRNCSLTAIRKKQRFIGPDDVLNELPAGPVANVPDLGELWAALSTLPPIHRQVVLMRFVDEMSLEEIALALEIPTGTVKSRLHTALKTLRNDPRMRRYFFE